jgi:hypothetical protein
VALTHTYLAPRLCTGRDTYLPTWHVIGHFLHVYHLTVLDKNIHSLLAHNHGGHCCVTLVECPYACTFKKSGGTEYVSGIAVGQLAKKFSAFYGTRAFITCSQQPVNCPQSTYLCPSSCFLSFISFSLPLFILVFVYSHIYKSKNLF